MVGAQKGLSVLVRNKMSHINLDPSGLFVCHCIIHQVSLCTESLKLNAVMEIVVSTMNLKKHGKTEALTAGSLGSYWVSWSHNVEIWFTIVRCGS